MTIEILPITKEFAAEVRGIDVREDLGADTVVMLEDALARYGVLVFKQQQVDDDAQYRFVSRFGPPLKIEAEEVKGTGEGNTNFFDVTTVDDQGRPLDENSARAIYLKANLLWHTDGSQAQPPVRLTALAAKQLPPSPPPTEYADMRSAYAALDEEKKRVIDKMLVEHSIVWSRSKMGMPLSSWSEATMRARPPVRHPLVRVNKRTGQKSLYLASHASHVIDYPLEDGRKLIEELTDFATRPRFIYSHAWEPGDLVVWDNSWTMHRATPYAGEHPRVLRWAGVRETAPTV